MPALLKISSISSQVCSAQNFAHSSSAFLPRGSNSGKPVQFFGMPSVYQQQPQPAQQQNYQQAYQQPYGYQQQAPYTNNPMK